MSTTDIALPRYDFYQTAEHVIAALYVKGLNAPGIQEQVDIKYQPGQVDITFPVAGGSSGERQHTTLGPLHASIRPDSSSARILGTKVELKLAKDTPTSWTTLLSNSTSEPSTSSIKPSGADISMGASTSQTPTEAAGAATSSTPSSSAFDNIGLAQPHAHIGGPSKINNQRKNWDKVVQKELDEKEDSKDPNAGGDQALQKMFASIYAGADDDTKRAMIKSFTESGGTSLSTNWSEVGKGQVPIRPPDGMEARKY